jgi:hypothetical protein
MNSNRLVVQAFEFGKRLNHKTFLLIISETFDLNMFHIILFRFDKLTCDILNEYRVLPSERNKNLNRLLNFIKSLFYVLVLFSILREEQLNNGSSSNIH